MKQTNHTVPDGTRTALTAHQMKRLQKRTNHKQSYNSNSNGRRNMKRSNSLNSWLAIALLAVIFGMTWQPALAGITVTTGFACRPVCTGKVF